MSLNVTVMMTTHNRYSKTLHCLASLYSQTVVIEGDVSLTTIIVDAGSTDGTVQRIEHDFPRARLINVSSKTYWAQGMRRAQQESQKVESDFDLWLNDDVALYKDSLERALATSNFLSGRGIIVGATQGPDGNVTYSGFLRGSFWNRLALKRVEPASEAVVIDTFNGNFVLVSRIIGDELGPIDSGFVHGMGDLDYGFRARKMAVKSVLMPGFIGLCETNLKQPERPGRIGRFRHAISPKQFPLKAWTKMCVRHGGIAAPYLLVRPYVASLVAR